MNTKQLTAIERAIALSRLEILALVDDGTLNRDPCEFSELHDVVDANELGGVCDDDFRHKFDTFGEWIRAVDTVQSAVDAWLKDGALAPLFPRVR